LFSERSSGAAAAASALLGGCPKGWRCWPLCMEATRRSRLGAEFPLRLWLWLASGGAQCMACAWGLLGGWWASARLSWPAAAPEPELRVGGCCCCCWPLAARCRAAARHWAELGPSRRGCCLGRTLGLAADLAGAAEAAAAAAANASMACNCCWMLLISSKSMLALWSFASRAFELGD